MGMLETKVTFDFLEFQVERRYWTQNFNPEQKRYFEWGFMDELLINDEVNLNYNLA